MDVLLCVSNRHVHLCERDFKILFGDEANLEVVKELVEKAENWDYELKGWRTLETKQDLINYLKKEVLEA